MRWSGLYVGTGGESTGRRALLGRSAGDDAGRRRDVGVVLLDALEGRNPTAAGPADCRASALGSVNREHRSRRVRVTNRRTGAPTISRHATRA